MLAFPAILPATLTLLEKKEGTAAATQVARGATLGCIGLVAFAVVCALLFDEIRVAFVLLLAAVAWALVAIVAYLVVVAFEKRAARSAERAEPKRTYASRPWHRSCDQRSVSSSAR